VLMLCHKAVYLCVGKDIVQTVSGQHVGIVVDSVEYDFHTRHSTGTQVAAAAVETLHG